MKGIEAGMLALVLFCVFSILVLRQFSSKEEENKIRTKTSANTIVNSVHRDSKDFKYTGSIYLVLVKDYASGEFWQQLARKKAIDVLILCWSDSKCANTKLNTEEVQWLYSPNTTWTTGRNQLLRSAQQREKDQHKLYQYYIFTDSDVRLNLISSKVEEYKDKLASGEPESIFGFRYFEHQLLEYQPPFAATNMTGHNCQENTDHTAIAIAYADACFNAFHREAIDFLLPYVSYYDSVNWWTSQAILEYRLLCFRGYRLQFNGFKFEEGEHKKYPKGGSPWNQAREKMGKLIPSYLYPQEANLQQISCVKDRVAQKKARWQEGLSLECKNFVVKSEEW